MESREAIDINLQNLWLSIKRRWLPAAGVFGCVLGVSAVAASLQQPVYQAQGKILLKKIDNASSLTDLSRTDNTELEPLSQEGNPSQTEIEIMTSRPLAKETIAALNLKDKKGATVQPTELLNKLKLKNVPATDVVQVAYESKNPEEAAAVVNKLMSLYVQNNILSNRAQTTAVGEFIAKQLPAVQVTLRQAEAKLRRFKEQNQVVNLDEEGKSAVTVIKELEDQVTATEAALVQAKTRSANLQKEIGVNSQDIVAVNSLNQSAGGAQKVVAELQQIEADLVALQTRFLDGHPKIAELQNKKAALKALLQQRITQTLGVQKQVPIKNLQMGDLKQKLTEEFVTSEVERLSLSSRLGYLSKNLSAYKQRANIIPKLEQQQQELERQVKASQATYEILLRKQQEVKVEENRNIGNASIIETALVPGQPTGGKTLITLGLGSVLATLLATGTILILEISDKSIKTLREVRDAFGYTVIACIPHVGKKVGFRNKKQEWAVPEIAVLDNSLSPIAENYRMLQANLKFLSSERALKAVVVSSSVPKEGKSTVSANLAAAIAQLGRRVLLVDADMRCPVQHHIWNINNVAGLSNVIVSQTEFQNTVQEVMTNLDVLTAGVMPPNPMALLDSQRMTSLVNYFTQLYDFVIIDAPPLVVAADALTLGKMTDGILLVARLDLLDFSSAASAKEALDRSYQKVLGLVVNGVNMPNQHYYKFHPRRDSDRDSEQLISTRKFG